MSISANGITKRFGQFVALDNVNVEVPSGTLVALLGPSGSGKTTLLRIIAGLEVADSGAVQYHEEDVTNRPARDRNVGFVFQHYALFRHMTVFENVAFGPRVRKWPKDVIEHKVNELLRLVRLDGMQKRYPNQLSGGQRQRVALARALAVEPKVLLLDEPFGALDAKVRQELRQWLRRLHDELHVTSLFVTHDQEEAFEVADRVVIMNRGRIEQVGSPNDVFEQPANDFVMDFLGNVNVFHSRIQDGKALLGSAPVTLGANATHHGSVATHSEGKTAKVYVRPHELDISRSPIGVESLRATVLHLRSTGPVVRVVLRASEGDQTMIADLSQHQQSQLNLTVGDVTYVSPQKIRVFLQDDFSI